MSAHSRPHDHDHDHDHDHGLKRFVRDLFVPHTHDSSDSIDSALEASAAGVRAVRVSLTVLLGTTVLQLVVVVISGSVALLADTIHNFSDALTAVPLWIAFVLGRRAANRRYTYGFGRAEDLAGLFVVLVVLASAVGAAWQSVTRLINPQPLENLWWVAAAGIIGNEAVAVYRIRVGRQIGSAALVADGVHARADGFTSLAVVAGAIGVMLGFPLADPIVGLLISIAILVLLIGATRSIGRRLMDGVEPDLLSRAEHAIHHVSGVRSINELRLRWVGHRLQGDTVISVDDISASAADAIADRVRDEVIEHLRNVDVMHVRTIVGPR